MDILKTLGLKGQNKSLQKTENTDQDAAAGGSDKENPHDTGGCCGSCGGGRH